MGRLLTKKGDSKLYAGLVTVVKFLNENSHYHICLSHLLLQLKGQGDPFIGVIVLLCRILFAFGVTSPWIACQYDCFEELVLSL